MGQNIGQRRNTAKLNRAPRRSSTGTTTGCFGTDTIHHPSRQLRHVIDGPFCKKLRLLPQRNTTNLLRGLRYWSIQHRILEHGTATSVVSHATRHGLGHLNLLLLQLCCRWIHCLSKKRSRTHPAEFHPRSVTWFSGRSPRATQASISKDHGS